MEGIRPPEMLRLSTSLHQAANAGCLALVTSHLQLGANVNEKNCKKQTALHLACDIVDKLKETDCRSRRIVELFLKSGAEDNVQEDSRSRRIVELLLKSGAEVNVLDENGRTPLHEACLNNNQSCVEALLRHGAKISVIDFAGRTPLHDALMVSRRRRSYDVTPVVNALMASCSSECSMENRPQQLAHVQNNVDILAVVNVQDNNGLTALHLASQRNDKELVYLLLRKGAILNIKENQGKTALHFAGEAHSAEVVDVLVDYGAYVNAKDLSGNTPLHLACSFQSLRRSFRSYESTIDRLLSRGAKVSERNFRQKTPIEELHDYWSPTSPANERIVPLKILIAIEKNFIRHVRKMKELKMHVNCDIQWTSEPVVCDEIRNECSKEIEDMKCTKIVKDITLYDVLSLINQPYLLSSHDLLVIDNYLRSPDIMKRFPLYCNSLKTAFQRSKLLTLAVQSFYSERRKSLVKKLPYEMTEHLMTFLSNEGLRNFLKSE